MSIQAEQREAETQQIFWSRFNAILWRPVLRSETSSELVPSVKWVAKFKFRRASF